jgi:hypothetical protein
VSSEQEVRFAVQHLLKTTTQCRHCNGTADLEYFGDGLTGVHVCSGRYVTRIISYRSQADPEGFLKFVQDSAKGSGEVKNADIRIARRYAWDLGMDKETDDLILTEAYWTQNYRRTKDENPNREAVFLCSNRDSFFVQPLTSAETLCASCRNAK